MKIFNWSIRGLNKLSRRIYFKELLIDHKVDLVGEKEKKEKFT